MGSARQLPVAEKDKPTVDAGTLEYLACLAGGTEPVALDLRPGALAHACSLARSSGGLSSDFQRRPHTLRFRHDLQFIDSRGSLLMRRVGNRSMLTWGRAMGVRGMRGSGDGAPESKAWAMVCGGPPRRHAGW
jgi:hypothetical protein